MFKPEFLNRLTEIVIFRQLLKEQMGSIVDLELEKVSERLKERKLKLDVSEEAKDFLIDHGYDNKLGARPLRRAVEKYLEDNLAEALLSGDFRKSVPINVLLHEDEQIGLRFEQSKKVKKKLAYLLPKRKKKLILIRHYLNFADVEQSARHLLKFCLLVSLITPSWKEH